MTHKERLRRRQEVAAAICSGMTPEDASKKFGLAVKYIYNVARERGIGVISHSERERRRNRAVELVRGGATLEQATKVTGGSFSTIRAACVAAGIPPTKKNAALSSFRILHLLLNGKPATSVAIMHKISRQRVAQIKQRAIEAGFKFPITATENAK